MKLTKAIKEHLSQDQLLAPVLEIPYIRKSHQSLGLFPDLVSAIISQQVSTSAARTIHQRLKSRFENELVTPQGIQIMEDDELRACGLSRQKTSYLNNIADHFIHSGKSHHDYDAMSDEEIVEDLTQIKGVGVWTVEMILMSTFKRPDVMPVGDLGIQNVMKQLYNIDDTGRALRNRMFEISEAWRPYRTYACLYLWNTLH